MISNVPVLKMIGTRIEPSISIALCTIILSILVAVPLGVLKTQVPSFTPPLPDERVEAVSRLGYGRYEKVVLQFAAPFWRDAGWSLGPSTASLRGWEVPRSLSR